MNQKNNDGLELVPSRTRAFALKGNEIERTRRALEEKAEQLALASKYKSEFLANMSHELRTPLNSLLVLSELLAENDAGNLTNRQVEFAETIHACGSELLALINDILDLAKIESGKMMVDLKRIAFRDLKKDLERRFCELAKAKRLDFRIEVSQRAARSISTDGKRLNQVLKNLLSNALKFTDKGSVTLRIDQDLTCFGPDTVLGAAKDVISFAVSDTGIGIAKDKQKLVFDPFQQADGTTSRKYGGTGLGLAISREIATLLGGQLDVSSEEGKGSTFTLHLPVSYAPQPGDACDAEMSAEDIGEEELLVCEDKDTDPFCLEEAVVDDRFAIRAGDLVLLIIEQDLQFAGMMQMLARERGFKTLITRNGKIGVTLSEKFLPQAITLDLKLADGEGWTILEYLRRSKTTRRIPLQLLSIDRQHSQEMNVGGPGTKSPDEVLDSFRTFLDQVVKSLPDDKSRLGAARQPDPVLANRTVLVLDDDPRNVFAIKSLLARHSVRILHAANGRDGLDLLYQNPDIECILMDVMMPTMDGYDTMREVRKHPKFCNLPIIALTANAMKGDREKCLEAGASDYIAKPIDTKQLISLLRVWLTK